MVLEEPTNRELGVMITGLRDELHEDHEEHTQFHAKIEGKLEALTNLFATLQRQVDVEKVRADAKVELVGGEVHRHEEWHERQAKDAAMSKERTATTASLIVGVFTAIGTTAGALVVLLVH